MDKIISIIIPVYRVEKYLKFCINSCLYQTYQNFEIIIVNDESDDKSLQIAREMAENDDRIFIITKRNGGLSSARNVGLEFIKNSQLRNYVDEKIKNLKDKYCKNDFINKNCTQNEKQNQHFKNTFKNIQNESENKINFAELDILLKQPYMYLSQNLSANNSDSNNLKSLESSNIIGGGGGESLRIMTNL